MKKRLAVVPKRKASPGARRTTQRKDYTEIVIRLSREMHFQGRTPGFADFSMTKVKRGYHESSFDPVQGWIAFE